MSRFRSLAVVTSALAIAAGGASISASAQAPAFRAVPKATTASAKARKYGASVKLGGGNARSYVTIDPTRSTRRRSKIFPPPAAAITAPAW